MSEEVKNALNILISKHKSEGSLRAKVISVDRSNNTIDASPVNGDADLLDVSLRATLDGSDKGFIIYPKKGAYVSVSIIDNNKSNAFVSQYSDIEDMTIYLGGKLTIKNEQEDLKKLMTDIITAIDDITSEIQKLTVTCSTPTSPSSVPLNGASFSTIQKKIQKFTTRLNKLLK